MDNSNFLIVVIPTYNRSYFLTRIVDSFFDDYFDLHDNLRKMVRLVILDNSENNDTENIIGDHKNRRYITYNKNASNLGLIGNLIQSYCYSHFEVREKTYVWAIGDDDLIKRGSLSRILTLLMQGNDCIILNYTHCNADYEFDNSHAIVGDSVSVRPEAAAILRTIIPKIGWIGSLIFRQSAFDRFMVEFTEKSWFPHVDVFLSVLNTGCSVWFDSRVFSYNRTGRTGITTWTEFHSDVIADFSKTIRCHAVGSCYEKELNAGRIQFLRGFRLYSFKGFISNRLEGNLDDFRKAAKISNELPMVLRAKLLFAILIPVFVIRFIKRVLGRAEKSNFGYKR